MKALGIILIVIALATLALPYITFTKQEKVLDVGPIHATTEKKESFPVSPVIGLVVLAVGGGILIAGGRKG